MNGGTQKNAIQELATAIAEELQSIDREAGSTRRDIGRNRAHRNGSHRNVRVVEGRHRSGSAPNIVGNGHLSGGIGESNAETSSRDILRDYWQAVEFWLKAMFLAAFLLAVLRVSAYL